MDLEAVKALREELEIQIRGKHCPAPITTWAQCGLSEKILSVLRKNKCVPVWWRGGVHSSQCVRGGGGGGGGFGV